jgi:ribosomal protein L27
VTKECRGSGARIGPDGEEIDIAIQAYADDVIFVSKGPEGVSTMLGVLESFVDWSRMEVNVKKCATASYLRDVNRHRCSLSRNLEFKNQPIPNLTLAQSLKYLGTAVAARRTVKLEAAEAKLTEMKVRLKKILESPLLIVQKIDAMKTFVLPMLDFMMLNGDVGEKQLMVMDRYIRGRVDELLKVRGLPVECHHASWRDGGLSYLNLVGRRRVLMIRSFTQMMLSKDDKVKKAMRWFAESERQYRLIGHDQEAQFLNWKKEEGKREKGTGSIIARTRSTCYKLGIGLKLGENEDAMKIASGESEIKTKTKTVVGIGRFLTQKLGRAKKIEKLVEHKVHGASFTTLKDNDTSNAMLTDIYTRRSDAFYRFVVVGRADCLPTPVNLQRWFGDRGEGNCPRCDRGRKQTLAHILNECTPNYRLMTKRHNSLAEVVRKALIRFVGPDMRSEIRENQGVGQEDLPGELNRQRPDMTLERRSYDQRRRRGRAGAEAEAGEGGGEQRTLEILEFSCPYGCISHGKNTLEKVYEEKEAKYEELARELRPDDKKK